MNYFPSQCTNSGQNESKQNFAFAEAGNKLKFYTELPSYFMQEKNSGHTVSRIILFVTIASLLLLSFLSYQKIKGLIDYSSRIQHVQEVQNSLEKIFSAVKDAESSQRGFLLTNDSAYLNTYYSSEALTSQLRIQFDSLIGKNPDQQKRADTLMNLIHERFQILNYMIVLSEEILSPISKSQLYVVMDHGKVTMDNIRSVINRLQNSENIALEKNKRETDRLITLTPIFLLLLSCFSISLLVISYFTIMSELNKRREFENELKKKIEELNRSNTDLEQFAYVASHDLQEPLRKIRSFGDRLVVKYSAELNEDARSTVMKIQNASSRMQKLIDDLLSFSRLIHTSVSYEKKDLNELLKEVLTDMDVTIRSTGAKIHSGPLPQLSVVPSLIRQLFQNLIGNSLKFAKTDVKPVIAIASTTVTGKEIPDISQEKINQQFYKIEFSDNGIGFEEKYNDRIFVIFQRLHGKLDYDGTGIGLAVCRKIMLIHRGYIFATSSPGSGATFNVYFPVD